jgi:FKBP-type peptidyl-prolyl cis-trans isomerase FklB
VYHPTIDSPTKCHYEGTLIDGTKFDSSYDRGSSATFQPQQVIKGWTEAMQMMVEGDKWELYIPSELAYGERGSPPKIGGGEALIFVMEMIEITGGKVPAVKCNVETYENCNEKEKSYVDKAKLKYETVDAIKSEITRIHKVSLNVSPASKAWANARIRILSALQETMDKDEL